MSDLAAASTTMRSARRHPWLRLDVTTAEHDFNAGGTPTGRYDCASVVLDEAAARALAADLLEWADTPKVHPREGAA